MTTDSVYDTDVLEIPKESIKKKNNTQCFSAPGIAGIW